jgi:hypothetical protein
MTPMMAMMTLSRSSMVTTRAMVMIATSPMVAMPVLMMPTR